MSITIQDDTFTINAIGSTQMVVMYTIAAKGFGILLFLLSLNVLWGATWKYPYPYQSYAPQVAHRYYFPKRSFSLQGQCHWIVVHGQYYFYCPTK